MREVRVSRRLAEAIAIEYGPERTGRGGASEWDFWSGPLAAALLGFQDVDDLPFDDVPAIRRLTVVDHVFGPVVFIGVVMTDGAVEIADYAVDPDYWSGLDDDPGS